MMPFDNTYISTQIYSKFDLAPTLGQKNLVEKVAEWIASERYGDIMILNGYAGTGKTTAISAIVRAMPQLGIRPVVLAPTGRAAKVAAVMSGGRASTIHRHIYMQSDSSDIYSQFSLSYLRPKDALFVIDEASMISDTPSEGTMFGSGSLLDDLMEYVSHGERCRIMFVGDSAQLPPVGRQISPALDPVRMARFGHVIYVTMDQVVRQRETSGILFNATLVRCMYESGIEAVPRFRLSFPDFIRLGNGEFAEALEECYSRYGRDDVAVITRSNRRANLFNQSIRARFFYAEEEIESGDMLMVVKNNYRTTSGEGGKRLDFIANGDIARVVRLRRFEEQYGFRFVEALLEFPDHDSFRLECRLLLDTLSSESPSLDDGRTRELMSAVEQDYSEITPRSRRLRAVREDSYFNALQVKFAYAVTCHKSQGGQWSAVFIDRLLFGDQTMSSDLLRWLYTAITRGVEKVYLVGFDDGFFEPDGSGSTAD